MEQTLQELTLLQARLTGAQACRNLIAKYCYFNNACRMKELLALWSDSDACRLETPWGIYLGKAGVSRCYLQDGIGDRSENPDKMKGILTIHEAGSVQVTVSEDGTSATASWISPGNVARPDPDGVCRAYWWWRRHKAAFTLEGSEWKFLQLTVAPVFRTPFDQNWLEAGPEDFSAQIQASTADLPPAEKPWFFDQPYKEVL